MLSNGATFDPGPLRGGAAVPGDKSISHRALIAGARGVEPLRISNLNPGNDIRATREALLALGARIEGDGTDVLVSGGRLREPPGALDCMNSGSTARMLLGACAGANVRARFDGDASLRRRPMEPVAAQLRAFGARIETTQGHLPLELFGTPEIETRNFILLAPSAQVKSALLFAGLFASVTVRVQGDRGSRDHTERLLDYLGENVEWDGRRVRLAAKPQPYHRASVEVAGDFSAAAFFITAAAITPHSAIVVRNTGVNPTRTGLLDILACMGAHIELRNERATSGEPVADIAVEYAPLHAASVGPDVALRAIDEIPLVAIAAAFAAGTTVITGVGDLRTKESDRIAAIERLLNAVAIESATQGPRLTIRGGAPMRPQQPVATHDDHRIAMAAAALACAAGPVAVDSVASLDVSFPAFLPTLAALRAAPA
ncbi:MAG TPA: 3-phosphoshikimate 1-carboxyvinyltransferase [Xanthobacteraceae bacterium]